MKKIIILLLLLFLVIGCTNYTKCSETEELTTGDYLVINGHKATLDYKNVKYTECCCDTTDLRVCICSKIHKK